MSVVSNTVEIVHLVEQEVPNQYQFRTTCEHSLLCVHISSTHIGGIEYIFLLACLIAAFQQQTIFTTELFYMSHSFPVQRIRMSGNSCHSANAILAKSKL